MKNLFSIASALVFFLNSRVFAAAPENQPEEPGVRIAWTRGPATAEIGGMAEIKVPEKFIYTGKEGTAKLMELMGNLPHDGRLGLLAPENFMEGGPDSWFVIFVFDESGYVKDNEKESLDAPALLKSMIEGSKQSNELRLKQGLGSLLIKDWAVPPHYDEQTNNLEWGLLLESKDESQPISHTVNYEVRLLGRKGVMECTLVLGPEQLESAMAPFRQTLEGFSYKPGHKYAEYRAGDKLAQYGLTALIGGGAVALAAKSGLLKYIWKFLVIGAVAAASLARKLFGKKGKDSEPPQTA